MNHLQIDNAEALRLFFQEELYVLPEDELVQKTVADLAEPTLEQNVEPTTASEVIATPIQEAPAVHITYLGGNEKQILILLKDTLHKDLHAEERKLLLAILDAIKVKVNDYALVFWDKHSTYSFEQFIGFLGAKKVLSFGMNAQTLGLDSLAYNNIHRLNEVEFILTSHLTDLKSDVASKKAFWSQLKVLFP